MSYGVQYGRVSPSFASQPLPGGQGYSQAPSYHSPSPQPGYQQGYPRAYSPQPGMPPSVQPNGPPAPAGAASQPQIQPGAITYTTSTGPDGRVVYHCFKAVPASYQTPNGIVSGIQWIPAEAVNVVPPGAQPAGADFAASWNRGHLSEDERKAIEKWQRDEEKRRRKDEKEASKRVQGWERERKDYQKQMEREERELAKARERDQYTERRRSGVYGTAGSAVAGGYPPAGYERERKYSTGGSPDLSRRLDEMSIGGAGAGYGHERKSSAGYAMPRSRRGSFNAGVLEDAVRGTTGSDYGSPYGSQVGAYQPPGGYAGSAGPYGTAPGRPLSRAGSPYAPSRSPLPVETTLPGGPTPAYGAGYGGSDVGRRTTDQYARPVSPYAGGGVPGSDSIYPRGHVLEGQNIPRSPIPGLPNNLYGAPPGAPMAAGGMPPIVPYSGSTSRPPSRIGGTGVAPGAQAGYGTHMPGAVDPVAAAMTPPEGFSRPPNRSQPYTAFEPIKIQDLDDFIENMPRMPLALVSHDVSHQDWIRFMTDVALAWTGRLPVPPGSRLPRPSTAVADLVEMWNNAFFTPRTVEVVLYKGRERRTGPDAGMVDNLPMYDGDDASSSSSSESEDSDDSGNDRYGGNYERREALRARRAERKAEKKRRRKEKKLRRKAREHEKRYSLYVTYLPPAHSIRSAATPLYAGM